MNGLFPFDSSHGARPARLLVSVADPAEVEAAIEGGADIIDVKDPTAGAIGRAGPPCMAEVVVRVGGRLPVTAAWGELAEAGTLDEELRQSLRGIGLVKFGTAQFQRSHHAWRPRWNAIRQSLPAEMALALVHYADGSQAEALPWEETLALAKEMQARALVVDTYIKGKTSLLDFYSPPALSDLVQKAHAQGIEVVLAGSLRAEHLAMVAACGAAIFGVRGAACRDGNRRGSVCRDQVAKLKKTLCDALRQTIAP